MAFRIKRFEVFYGIYKTSRITVFIRQDAVRDLTDIGASDIPVHAFHKFKYGSKISDKENGYIKEGVIFGTYASLIGERHHDRMKTTKMGKILKVRVNITRPKKSKNSQWPVIKI